MSTILNFRFLLNVCVIDCWHIRLVPLMFSGYSFLSCYVDVVVVVAVLVYTFFCCFVVGVNARWFESYFSPAKAKENTSFCRCCVHSTIYHSLFVGFRFSFV